MTRKKELGALAGVLLPVALAFADLFAGRSFFIRDLARIYVPERAILRRLLLSGSFPFWNPFAAGGQPLAAIPTAEVFYPPQWLVLLPDLLTGIRLEIVLHFLIAAAGMYCLLRAMRLRGEAAAFGAVSFALSGMMMSLISLLPCLFIMAWLPWLALFTRRALDEGHFRDRAAASLILGIIYLVAEPATMLQASALVLAYALARRGVRGARVAIAIGLLALLVGAGQLVPALDHQRDSGRGAPLPYEQVTQWSMAPLRPLELAGAELFGRYTSGGAYFVGSDHPSRVPWLFSWYCGLLAAALIAAGFVHRIRGWRFTAGVTVVSYLLALGRHTPAFRILYLAGLRFIRYPEKWFLPAAFVLVIFAAVAADRFLTDAAFRRTTFRASLAFIALAAIALALAYTREAPPDVLAQTRLGALMTLATAVALSLILLARERPRAIVVLLALFTLADLIPRGRAVAPRIDDGWYAPPPIAHSIPLGARVYNDADWEMALAPPADLPFAARWRRVRNAALPETQALWGFDGVLANDVTLTNLKPSRAFAELFLRARFGGRPQLVPMLLSFAGATHVIALRDPLSPNDPVRVVALPGNARYWFATALAETGHITDPHPWPRGIAFTDAPFAPARGRVTRVRERANGVDLDVVAGGEAALILAITPHKYWRATIDGAPSPLHVANVGFQLLRVPPGAHHIALRYRNPLVVWCGLMTIVSALALLAAALRSRGSRQPSPR